VHSLRIRVYQLAGSPTGGSSTRTPERWNTAEIGPEMDNFRFTSSESSVEGHYLGAEDANLMMPFRRYNYELIVNGLVLKVCLSASMLRN